MHAKYFQLILFPVYLCYDYSLNAIPIVRDLGDVRVVFAGAMYATLFGAVWISTRLYNRDNVLGYQMLVSLVIMIVPWIPAANIFFPVGTVIGERLLYTPSVGFVLFVCAAVKGMRKRWLVQVFVVTVVVYSIRTTVRVCEWADGDTLFIADGHRQESSSKAQFNLGITHMSRKNYEKAIPALIRCAAADPMSALPYWRIGQIEVLRGNYVSAEKWLMEASTKFSATLMIKDEEIFHDIAVAVFQNKKHERAMFYLGLAIEINSRFPKGLNNYGCLLASRGENEQAVKFLRRAAELKGSSFLYLSNLVFMARHVGDLETAQWAERKFKLSFPGVTEVKGDCIWEFVPAS